MNRSIRRFVLGAGTWPALALGMLVAQDARAQSDKAGAEALMNEAVRLTGAHDYANACPKFEESLRLFTSVNTEYFLADCYEHTGKMASAWIDYLEVAEKARAAGEPTKEARARDRAAKIEAKVSHLTIQVSAAPASGLTIDRDGVSVGRAQWGIAMPIDPGEHTVVASAPGRVATTQHVTVSGDGGQATVVIPALEGAPAAPTPVASVAPASSGVETTPPPASQPAGHGQRVAGAIVAGTGVVVLGIGGVLAISAKSSYDGAPGCSGTVCQMQSSLDTRSSARSLGNVATVMVIGGAVVAVGGAVLWLTAPRTPKAEGETTLRDWRVGVGPGSLVMDGRF